MAVKSGSAARDSSAKAEAGAIRHRANTTIPSASRRLCAFKVMARTMDVLLSVSSVDVLVAILQPPLARMFATSPRAHVACGKDLSDLSMAHLLPALAMYASGWS